MTRKCERAKKRAYFSWVGFPISSSLGPSPSGGINVMRTVLRKADSSELKAGDAVGVGAKGSMWPSVNEINKKGVALRGKREDTPLNMLWVSLSHDPRRT